MGRVKTATAEAIGELFEERVDIGPRGRYMASMLDSASALECAWAFASAAADVGSGMKE